MRIVPKVPLLPTPGGFVSNLEELVFDPKRLLNHTPHEWFAFLKENNYNQVPLSGGSLKGMPFESGGGFKVNLGGNRILQFHPAGGGHHGGVAYWKVTTMPEPGRPTLIRFNLDGSPTE